jgi:hypothetical protein
MWWWYRLQPVEAISLFLFSVLSSPLVPSPCCLVLFSLLLLSPPPPFQFAKDVRLVWANCSAFNNADSEIMIVALKFSKMFETLLLHFILQHDRHIWMVHYGGPRGAFEEILNRQRARPWDPVLPLPPVHPSCVGTVNSRVWNPNPEVSGTLENTNNMTTFHVNGLTNPSRRHPSFFGRRCHSPKTMAATKPPPSNSVTWMLDNAITPDSTDTILQRLCTMLSTVKRSDYTSRNRLYLANLLIEVMADGELAKEYITNKMEEIHANDLAADKEYHASCGTTRPRPVNEDVIMVENQLRIEKKKEQEKKAQERKEKMDAKKERRAKRARERREKEDQVRRKQEERAKKKEERRKRKAKKQKAKDKEKLKREEKQRKKLEREEERVKKRVEKAVAKSPYHTPPEQRVGTKGTRVRHLETGGHEYINGVVLKYVPPVEEDDDPFWFFEHEDGDGEELELHELLTAAKLYRETEGGKTEVPLGFKPVTLKMCTKALAKDLTGKKRKAAEVEGVEEEEERGEDGVFTESEESEESEESDESEEDEGVAKEDDSAEEEEEDEEDSPNMQLQVVKSSFRLSMKEMVADDILTPGSKVLRMGYKGVEYLADLTSLGEIVYEGSVYKTPSSFSSKIKGMSDNGWTTLYYQDVQLKQWASSKGGTVTTTMVPCATVYDWDLFDEYCFGRNGMFLEDLLNTQRTEEEKKAMTSFVTKVSQNTPEKAAIALKKIQENKGLDADGSSVYFAKKSTTPTTATTATTGKSVVLRCCAFCGMTKSMLRDPLQPFKWFRSTDKFHSFEKNGRNKGAKQHSSSSSSSSNKKSAYHFVQSKHQEWSDPEGEFYTWKFVHGFCAKHMKKTKRSVVADQERERIRVIATRKRYATTRISRKKSLQPSVLGTDEAGSVYYRFAGDEKRIYVAYPGDTNVTTGGGGASGDSGSSVVRSSMQWGWFNSKQEIQELVHCLQVRREVRAKTRKATPTRAAGGAKYEGFGHGASEKLLLQALLVDMKDMESNSGQEGLRVTSATVYRDELKRVCDAEDLVLKGLGDHFVMHLDKTPDRWNQLLQHQQHNPAPDSSGTTSGTSSSSSGEGEGLPLHQRVHDVKLSAVAAMVAPRTTVFHDNASASTFFNTGDHGDDSPTGPSTGGQFQPLPYPAKPTHSGSTRYPPAPQWPPQERYLVSNIVIHTEDGKLGIELRGTPEEGNHLVIQEIYADGAAYACVPPLKAGDYIVEVAGQNLRQQVRHRCWSVVWLWGCVVVVW